MNIICALIKKIINLMVWYGVFTQVSSNDISGAVLLQSPFLRDFDEREIFCLYLFPGNGQSRKVSCNINLLLK